MKSNFKSKVLILFHLFISASLSMIYANDIPSPPMNNLPGSGGGGSGPGTPATPIDMYQIVLLIVAIGLVTYFYKKIKLSII